MRSFKRSKTSGTGMSQSHIGKANMDALEAAANAAGSTPFVEPAAPPPGQWALWVSPSSMEIMGPVPAALQVIWTDNDGVVHRKTLDAGIVGPGPVLPP